MLKLQTKNTVKKAGIYALTLVMALGFAFPGTSGTVVAQSLSDQIDSKEAESNNLQSKISELEGQIKEKQDEAASLRNQVGIFEDQIQKQQLEVDKKQSDIDKTNLEIKKTTASIKQAEEDIAEQKIILAEFIRTLSYSDDTSPVELMLSDNSFSDILDNVQRIETLQGNVQDILGTVRLLKSELEFQKEDLETKKGNLEAQKTEFARKVSELQGSQLEKQRLLDLTKSEESEFQSLLGDAKSDYNAKQSEIASLEKKLRESQIQYGEPQPYNGNFLWPLPAGAGVITCGFQCAGYFPGLTHTGVDIAAPSGTPIYSVTEGTVVHAGWSSNGGGYGNYVAISSGNLLIIYGHMSSVGVSVGQSVSVGSGLGGVGTTGFSTGNHLHLEFRLNGTPVNPFNYL